MLSRADDASAHFTEANPVAVALAMARNRKSVAILEPFAGFAARKLHGVCATPRQLEHATARVFGRSANRAARQQIARLKIATIDRVVCELLRNAPVKISEICAGDGLQLGHFRGLQSRFELNVESKIICAFQVRQWRWILCRQAFTEQLQRLQRDHPRRDAGAKIFRQERAQRLVFPGLNVPRAPVVHQNDSENVILRSVDGNRLTKRIAGTNEEGRFQFEIEALARAVNRAACIRQASFVPSVVSSLCR